MATDELPDHTEYLASQVLNEGNTVSYRNLSRALKVHVNIAKRMLFDFHQRQNRKKPKTVHAIYLLKGRDRPDSIPTAGTQNGEDTVMQSSPPFSSSAVPRINDEEDPEREAIDTSRITLAKEDDLAKVKASFEELQSIHIYSLSPAMPNDLEVLTDCSRRVAVASISEDPLKDWQQYGVIQNDHVKRRTLKRPPPASAPRPEQKPALASSKQTQKTTTTIAPTTAKKEDQKPAAPTLKHSESSEQSRPPSRTSTSSKTASKPPTVKRESSNLMKAFANAPPKKPKPEPQPKDDEPPALSDEEADAEDMDLDEGAITANARESEKKSKKAREAELQAMMDAEDEDMPDAEPAEPVQPADGSEDQAPGHEHSQQSKNAEDVSQDTNTEEAALENGRRRGRRRVLKKRTVKDDEGYLVTREEAVWESFSEDEPTAKKAVVARTAAGPGRKAAGGKKGQGSIMSFFGKK